mmetsp:Transcript_4892/g.9102  ORF Transcript_4892/g.9102 Transcript_4892/m.9102 type:complete len:219 (+) Transcript_4892:125-781(+)
MWPPYLHQACITHLPQKPNFHLPKLRTSLRTRPPDGFNCVHRIQPRRVPTPSGQNGRSLRPRQVPIGLHGPVRRQDRGVVGVANRTFQPHQRRIQRHGRGIGPHRRGGLRCPAVPSHRRGRRTIAHCLPRVGRECHRGTIRRCRGQVFRRAESYGGANGRASRHGVVAAANYGGLVARVVEESSWRELFGRGTLARGGRRGRKLPRDIATQGAGKGDQ